jgi:hypothetical protein
VVDLLPRKKLFRPETAASPGLGEEDELLDGAHSAEFRESGDTVSLLSAFCESKERKDKDEGGRGERRMKAEG